MKRIFKILAVALAIGALAQTIAQAKNDDSHVNTNTVVEKSSPGI